MLISGTEAAHPPPAISAAVTEDGQSVRPINLNGTLTVAPSDAPTTSFRNFAAVDRGTVSSQRRGNVVLFVKTNDNESDAPHRGVNNASMPSQHNGGGSANGSDNSQGGDGEEGGDAEQEDLLSLVVSTVTSGGSTAVNVVTGAARKPLLTAAIVLLYFILLDIVMLRDNERLNRILRRVRATDNDALVVLSSSLVRQLKDARQDLHEALALNDPPATLERLEIIQHRALALERVCNRSLARLHLQLMFPGTPDDLAFLVEQHVDFDRQLQSLAGEELEWMSTVMASSVVQLSDDAAPEGQRFVLGPHAGAHGSVPAGASGGAAVAAEDEAAAPSNPLRNVRLERTKPPGNAGTASHHPSGGAHSRLERAAAAARGVQSGAGRKGKRAVPMTEVEEAEKAAGGLAGLLKNRFVAFFLICVLLAAVLRMG